MNIRDFFSVDRELFNIFGYSMSHLEFWGTILNLASVWLMAKKNILTWPIGILGVVLFAFLFFQIQLYSDFFEQIYYFVTGFYGWWLWTSRIKTSEDLPFQFSNQRQILRIFSLSFLISVLVGWFVSQIHEIWPDFFKSPAAFPFLDSFTTVMSLTAQILMVYRRTESWIYWILIDLIGVVLYAVKGVYLVSALYVIFLVIAAYGFLEWKKSKEAIV